MIERIKNICDYVSRGTAPDYVDEGNYRVINQATFSKGFLDLSNVRYTTNAKRNALVQNGDLLIASTGGGVLGKVYYYGEPTDNFYADSHVSILRSKRNNMKFIFYFFSTRYDEINAKLALGSTNQTELQRDLLLSYELQIPSLPDQNRIVAYLDEKCADIDNNISVLRQKKDKYEFLKKSIIQQAVTKGLNPDVEMKESSEEWMGGIPMSWSVCRLKDISSMYSGLTGKAGDDFRCDDPEATKPFIPFTNILNNDRIDFSQFKPVVMEDGEEQNQVKEGDILFLMSSEDYESIGKTSVVIGDPGEVYLNSFCRGLRFNRTAKVIPSFVSYQLSSELFRDTLRFEAKGFTRINLKIEKIANMSIALPSVSEQIEIVDYLNKKCEDIKTITDALDTQIEKYNLLKKSLINEVITGQRAV